MAAPSRNSISNGKAREGAEERTAEATAPSRHRRRARKHRGRDVQGFELGRSRRRLPELCRSRARVARQGAADRRQRADALFRGAPPPSPRSGRRGRVSDVAAPEKERWIDRPGVRRFLGRVLIGNYLRFLRMTARVVADPPDFWESAHKDWPAIAVSWHGQSSLAYVVMPDPKQVALLLSMPPGGLMMGAMARSLGYQTVDGSGASTRQKEGTGGLAAVRNMLKALRAGTTLLATADIPPEPGRNVSLGMIALARKSGRPVYAIATASSRRKVLDRVWDKMQLNYPFSTIGFACEGPFYMTDAAVTDVDYANMLRESLDRVL